MLYAILIVIAAILAFIGWRYTSVARGARKRDEAIFNQLEPLGKKLDEGQSVEQREVEALARVPQNRPFLYRVLLEYKRLDLFPDRYLSLSEQAKAELAYWMMHPNELQNAPEELEAVESLERTLNGKRSTFVVLRYRMPQGHWAGPEWLLGLVGPFFDGEDPYLNSAAGFSRADDRYGVVTPTQLVDWYIGMLKAKGMVSV
jgi:hypothetical protein